MKPSALSLALSALALALSLAGAGCGKERGRDEGPVSVPVPSSRASAVGPAMRVVVSELVADPTIDPQGVRSVFRDAETSLFGCLDAGSGAGNLALSFPIEHDGSVGNVVEGSRTTLAGERARLCITRIVRGMRFARASAGRAEVAVTLEVRPRRAVE